MRILIFFLIIILSLKNILYASVQNKILVNVGSNQIITSYELKNRIKTILVLNNKELNQENVNKTKKEALNFLINFKLKKIEILKFNIPTNKKSVSDYIDGISSSYNTDGLGFKKIFLDNNLDYELFLDGIETEFAWQQLILNSYGDKIVVNEKEIDKELNTAINNQKKSEEYNLAEIEIFLENNFEDKRKIQEIKKQISEVGFENTAIKYSKSLSALEGGNLGWVASQAMSNVILSVVKNMSPGDVSEPIIKSETALFIKLLDKRKVEFSDINLNTMKNKIISQRKNELLNLFSNSYLSKVKNNTLIQYNE
tara:strand:+ start:47 stop:982 length:936 start_codon:yes stop_codon:yes gene_type:complete